MIKASRREREHVLLAKRTSLAGRANVFALYLRSHDPASTSSLLPAACLAPPPLDPVRGQCRIQGCHRCLRRTSCSPRCSFDSSVIEANLP
jgi:hypothetical protein